MIYEAIDGPTVALEALTPSESEALRGPLADLHPVESDGRVPAPEVRVARTPGGLVLLIAPALKPGS